MTNEDFTTRITELADFFQKDMKPEALIQWYREFSWLVPFQLDIIVREAKRDCERFPPGKYFHDQIRNHNFYPPGREGQRSVEQMVAVICKCGYSFAVQKVDLEKEGVYFPAWKDGMKGCPECHAMYSGEFIVHRMKNDIAEMA